VEKSPALVERQFWAEIRALARALTTPSQAGILPILNRILWAGQQFLDFWRFLRYLLPVHEARQRVQSNRTG
jgi:hypothetical protein